MSISPSTRLLWVVGLILLPACALPAFVPFGKLCLMAITVAVTSVSVLDLIVSRSILNSFSVVVPEQIRATLNEEKAFPVVVRRVGTGRPPRHIRLAVALPSEIEGCRDEIGILSPEREQDLQAELSLLGRQRGKFPLSQALLGSQSRLGLWDLRRSIAVKCQILVEPSLSDIAKQAARILASHRRGGQLIVARNGRGREFEQLREYVPHDDFGDIDWKATARKRRPIVREYQIERTQDIYVCIDFSRLSAQAIARKDKMRSTILDEYIHSTLVLHRAVREMGDRFGFATFSNRVECFVKAVHAASFDSVFRRALYPLRAAFVAPAYDEICSSLRSRAKRRALVVFFTSLSEPQLAESFIDASRLLAHQHLVVVACPTDTNVKPLFASENVAEIEEIYGELAGHLLWKKLAELRATLRSVGIRMHSVAPGKLGLVAATEYLEMKERQLL